MTTRSDELMGDYDLTLEFLSALRRFTASFDSLLWFSGLQCCCFVLTTLTESFSATAGSSFQMKGSDKPSVCYLPSTKWQTNTGSG